MRSGRAFGGGKADPIAPGDNRFADRAWQANPAFRTLADSYVTTVHWVQQLVDTSHAPAAQREKARFALNLMLDALAPTNVPWMNPAVLKETFETGGQSLVVGASNSSTTCCTTSGRPRQVDTASFSLGKNLAATPGRVVMRNSLIELLMYEPKTDLVHAQPILCSPPWINKYYIMDLAPGRSFIEYAVQHGFTVFCISYRTPSV